MPPEDARSADKSLVAFAPVDHQRVLDLLLAFERKHGVSAPDDWRKFILSTNGGKPPKSYDSDELNDIPLISFFFGMYANPTSDEGSDYEYQYRIYANRIPKNCLPVAYDPFGNLYLLHTSSPIGIHFWDHEEDDGKDAFEGPALDDSFTHFFARYKNGVK